MATVRAATKVGRPRSGHPSAKKMSESHEHKEKHMAAPVGKLHKTGAKELVGKMADMSKHHAKKAVEHHVELMHHHKMVAHHSKKMAHHAKHAGKHHKAK